MATTATDARRDLFITGLRNIHAVEKQALSIMTPQVERIEHYPEVAERLRAHIEETHGQIARLDEILAGFQESHSTLKDAALSMSGGMAAITHSIAGDEILKNSFANYAFEHFEMASYMSLLALVDDGGFASAKAALEQSLGEEKAMAQWIGDHLPEVTRRYASLYESEGTAQAKV
jgi:ferritin-like metal-binding protein YciE